MKNNINRLAAARSVLLASTVLLGLSTVGPAIAQSTSIDDTSDDQQGVDLIIVTANKRGAASAQDIAGSITAFDENKLERLDALDFDDFIVQVPGTNFISNGGAGRGNEVASIRGLSPVADNTLGVVAQYLDGAPRFGENFRLFDIGEVSVLRGPQGTLWGAQAIGGLISYRSNRADPTGFTAQLQSDIYTTKDDGGVSYRIGGHVNLPLVEDRVALRLAGHFIDESGYIDNVTTGANDVNNVKEGAWRASLYVAATESLEFNIIYHGNDLSSDAPTFFDLALGDYEIADPFTNSPADQEYDLINFIGEADLGWATLSYNGSYFEQERLVIDFAENVFGFLPLTQTNSPDEQKSWTHEVRLASTYESPLQWIVGFYYDDLQTNDPATQFTIDATGDPTVPPLEVSILGGREDRREWAIFGEAEYNVTDQFSVLFGGRYFDWEVDNQEEFTFFGGNFQQETGVVRGDDFFFKVQATYDLNDDLQFYALRSEGFRFGGFNPFVGPALNIPEEFVRFDPDSLVNYEGGVKSVWADGRVVVNAAGYFMVWDNIQTVVRNETETFAFTTNAPRLNAHGAELEIVTQDLFAPGVYLSGTYAYTKNEFKEDATVFPVGPAGPLIEEGEELRRTPRHTWSLDAGYDFDLGNDIDAYIRMNYWHKAATTTEGFNSQDGAVPIPAQDVVNFSVGAARNGWSVKLYADNATNAIPLLQVFPASAAGGPGGDQANRASTLRPRTFGIELTKVFSEY